MRVHVFRFLAHAPCQPRCGSCVTCPHQAMDAPEETVADALDRPVVCAGGGDALAWPHLAQLLRGAAQPGTATWSVVVEAPLHTATPDRVAALAWNRSLQALRVVVDLHHPRWRDDPDAVARAIEALGAPQRCLEVVIPTPPQSLPQVDAIAGRVAPRPVWLELAHTQPYDFEAIEELLLRSESVGFYGLRMPRISTPPPCLMPTLWRRRPRAWHWALHTHAEPNHIFNACAECSVRRQCRWSGRPSAASQRPPKPPTRGERTRVVPRMRVAVGRAQGQARQEGRAELFCTAPWTGMEITDLEFGTVTQCVRGYVTGSRGNVYRASPLAIWNGPGYRALRRLAAQGRLHEQCRPICMRLYDLEEHEHRFRLRPGTERFVRNELLLAEDIAQRREVVRGLPLRLTASPTTYCNYDCEFCGWGRTERNEAPDAFWEDLDRMLPTLETLTLVGGEPTAHRRVLHLLERLDVADYPDLFITLTTNGSLLKPPVLRRLHRTPLGSVVVSLNAGRPDVYGKIMRGGVMERVMRHIEGLLELRRQHPRDFDVIFAAIVQPVSSGTLVELADIVRRHDLQLRLFPLAVGRGRRHAGANRRPTNPSQVLNLTAEERDELDYYTDPAQVRKVLDDLDDLERWCRYHNQPWGPQVRAVRAAIEDEARLAGGLPVPDGLPPPPWPRSEPV